MTHFIWPQVSSSINLWRIVSLSLYGLTLLAPSALAQVTPDQTLGAERSRVSEIDQLKQRIDGGAARGRNLFHSFQEFNVAEGRGVYFANPAGIENILSRVTGQNPSHIFGTLGVLGKADLYLLNPQGIIFGPNASLDLQGSFHGSTADSVALGDSGSFSAVEPQQSQLLSVRPSVGFLTQATNHSGSIINQGQLAAGQDLSLTGGQLDLQGQVLAGRNLTLQATDSVKIRDSDVSPFIAAAGNQLLVQGNQAVDIFALNHPDSGLFSGGDMVLRSANPVGGDAHYTSGGNFSVESLSGQSGNLFSPRDPIIRSLGDVSFNNYLGSSLHILAAGSVTIGTVTITDVETGLSNTDFTQQTVQLSDGSELSIDGSSQPTLDIRAGVRPEEISSSGITGVNNGTDFFFDDSFFPSVPVLRNVTTNADVFIDNISIIPSNSLVYLTTQYKPSSDLAGGDITVSGGINATAGVGNGGDIILDSRNNIELVSMPISTTSQLGNAGNIMLFADQDISITNGASLESAVGFQGNSGKIKVSAGNHFLLDGSDVISSVGLGGFGDSGTISILAKSIEIIDGSSLTNSNFGVGNLGAIKVEASDSISLEGSNIASTLGGQGNTGIDGIELTAGAISIKDSFLLASTFGQGNSGRIKIMASEIFSLNQSNIASTIGELATGNSLGIDVMARSIDVIGGSVLTTNTSGNGDAGPISIRADQDINLVEGSQLRSTTFGLGSAGDVMLDAGQDIILDGIRLSGSRVTQSGIFTINFSPVLGAQNSQSGGNIFIIASSLALNNGAQFNTSTIGQGDAGRINIQVAENLTLTNGSQLRSETAGLGKGGDVTIRSGQKTSIDGTQVSSNQTLRSGVFTSSFSQSLDPEFQGDRSAGDISVAAQSFALSGGAQLSTSTSSRGDAGRIDIQVAESFTLVGDSQLRSTTSGLGSGGDVSIISAGEVSFDGIQAADLPSGISTINLSPVSGNSFQRDRSGGDIFIEANSLSLANGAQLNTSTAGQGNAGNVSVNARDFVSLSGGFIFSTAELPAVGKGGAVDIQAKSLTLDNASQIATNTFSPLPIITPTLTLMNSRAGDITIRTDDVVALDKESGILSSVGAGGVGSSGDIQLETSELSLLNGSQIQALLFREQGGLLGGQGVGGTVDIDASDSVIISGIGSTGFSSGLLVLSERGAFGPAGDINVTTKDFLVSNGAVVAAGTFNDGGVGGDITITAATFKALNGGQILTNTRSGQDAGSIKLNIADTILIDGTDLSFDNRLKLVEQQIQRPGSTEQVNDVVINEGSNSGLFASTSPGSTGDGGNIVIDPITTTLQNQGVIAVDSQGAGKGGDIELQSGNLFLNNRAEIRASSQGSGNSGRIVLSIDDLFSSTDSDITTAAAQAAGGVINISAGDIRLSGDSDIRTNVAVGSGGGGNITLTANTILAFNDSDILAFADPTQGQGGNILLNTPAFFGQNFFDASSSVNPNALDGNASVDLNATGQTSGIVSVPDVSFIQNNLTDLPENLINTENLLANSCIVRIANQQGKFIVTGPGGLPVRPGDAAESFFPTGTVQTITEKEHSSEPNAAEPWKVGDPIVEPQGAYELANGKLVMSRLCLR